MKQEFMIERHGKKYVLFAGLLDEAHERGLRGIDTELIQVPGADNGNVAICKATVELEDGRTFSGIGDASPDNVGRAIAVHLIRMAETRAKARALRDSVNIGVTALEELGGDDSTNQPTGGRETGKSGGQGEEEPERTKGGATIKAANYLKNLAAKKYGSVEAFEKQAANKPIDSLSARDVKHWIEDIK